MPVLASSEINKGNIKAEIRNGATKINIETAIRQKYKKELNAKDVPFAQRLVREEVKNLIDNYFEVRGSALELASLLSNDSMLRPS